MTNINFLKELPSIDSIMEDGTVFPSINILSRKGVLRIAREVVDGYRERIRAGKEQGLDGESLRKRILNDVNGEIEKVALSKQRRVINATGVILHTNLGRSLLSEKCCEAIQQAARGYVDLELEIESARRCDRTRSVRRLLALLTGSEDALVVNNNAAAVLLAVHTLGAKGGVAVSRGELVEIGGSFRLPEILSSAVDNVMEIGTTNKTHIEDYEQAVEMGASLILKVHTSNYRIVGFTGEVSLSELVELGRDKGVPVMYDQGSGILFPFDTVGVEGEENIEDIVKTGVDLVSFSTDKVLGGPQGGAIVGRGDIISRLKRNHISRALRMGKLNLAALEQVLIQYWKGEFNEIPTYRMITTDYDSLHERAEKVVSGLRKKFKTLDVNIVKGESAIGGGSYPTNPLPSPLIEINLGEKVATGLSRRLRTIDPALMVRVKGDAVLLDLRTVSEEDDIYIVKAMIMSMDEFIRRE